MKRWQQIFIILCIIAVLFFVSILVGYVVPIYMLAGFIGSFEAWIRSDVHTILDVGLIREYNTKYPGYMTGSLLGILLQAYISYLIIARVWKEWRKSKKESKEALKKTG